MQAIHTPSDITNTADTTASRLLATAAALFRKKGYANSTIRELATRLGIQKASLYHHIAKKEDLLYALCVDALQRIHSESEQAIAAHTAPLERLRALIHAHLRAALTDQDKHATMLIELRELSKDRYAEVLQLRDRYEALVRQTITEAQAAGVLRENPSAKYQTLALLNQLNWTIIWFRPDGELTPDQLGEILATLFLEGAQVRPAEPLVPKEQPS
jgi:AcrR family transcriptional regulator